MARLLSTRQIIAGDTVTVEIMPGQTELVFLKEEPGARVPQPQPQDCDDELWEYYASVCSAGSSPSQNVRCLHDSQSCSDPG
jgi:hypothetical protein